MGTPKPLEDGFTADGYIRDQDCFSGVRYRTMPASINGCGWIAAYNLRHALGQTPDWAQVRRELDEMHRLRIPGPTLMTVMRAYLSRYVPQVRETAGREEAVAAAADSAAGIFRYREGREPHGGRPVPLLQRDRRAGGLPHVHGALRRGASAGRHGDRIHGGAASIRACLSWKKMIL